MPVPFSRGLRNWSALSPDNPQQQSRRDRDEYRMSKLPQLVHFTTHEHTSSFEKCCDFWGELIVNQLGTVQLTGNGWLTGEQSVDC
jgi:hypothetical protein